MSLDLHVLAFADTFDAVWALVLPPPIPARPDLPRGLRQPANRATWTIRASPRVCTSPQDGISARTQWFELLGRLCMLLIADRPTLCTIQAGLIAPVYAVDLGKLSKAATLLSEPVTISIDAELHRSMDTYDPFDAVEDEVRKRTFWCAYIWDKQLHALWAPAPVDDEWITRGGAGMPVLPPSGACRLAAFVVLDVPPVRDVAASPFLGRSAVLLGDTRHVRELREEEALVDEIHRGIPPFFAHTPETLAREDTVRLTQAEHGRYICGLRSGDLMEEFYWLTQIPLDAPGPHEGTAETSASANTRALWIRPVGKKSVAANVSARSAADARSASPPSTKSGSRDSPEGREEEEQQTTSFKANPGEFNPKDAKKGQGLGFPEMDALQVLSERWTSMADVGSSPTRDSIFGKGAFVSRAFPGCHLDFRDLTAGNLARMREVMRLLESVQRRIRALPRKRIDSGWISRSNTECHVHGCGGGLTRGRLLLNAFGGIPLGCNAPQDAVDGDFGWREEEDGGQL
ncbi:hypothetical protein B0H17DRAFT_1198536 [Mycena rosella]|uniref:Xylanolytic transcriptional activator regulatory domain-containing protein n=1 Tax=Mycena rosella TaxID=1033263 RepID=A0AAD7DN56_MYCRO|nr:hypothetical protein B0H17DRAFT_1198536 [Mycena rosella]